MFKRDQHKYHFEDIEITDEVIKEYLFKNGYVIANNIRMDRLNHYTSIKEYLENRYPDFKSYTESAYRIYYGLEERPVCEVCKKEVNFDTRQIVERGIPFRRFCSNQCSHDSSLWKEEVKRNNLVKYGVEYPAQNKTVLNKMLETKRRTHVCNTSKPEKELEEILKKEFIDVVTQEPCDVYPFMCDFYIKSLDLYMEYQGVWTHGYHPFDPNNPNDILYLNYMKEKHTKFYESSIKTWTYRDMMKRETAKKNGLNYLEVYEPFSRKRDYSPLVEYIKATYPKGTTNKQIVYGAYTAGIQQRLIDGKVKLKSDA